MKAVKYVPKQHVLASALMVALAGPAFAQQASPPPATQAGTGATATATTGQDAATTLDTVQVTGIRGSLTSSMNLKRDAQGVVDGIVAEDIGKFPDSNLAESLQRISGVSIDRSNGEGSRVTVRGMGPDFNLVLLNGRQMPTSTGSRAFEFSDLASEAISQVDVYKTSRADIPTGGIGATINIRTARPLDNPGTHASAAAKGVWDTSDDDLPGRLKGSSVTPELSGIFSTTSADGQFGLGISASYQERDSGSASAFVAPGNGWRPFIDTPQPDGVGGGSALPLPGQPGSQNIANRPGPNDVYSMPQSLGYSINSVERKRTNGQAVLQWRPIEELTATLDYTYSENKIHSRRNDMSVWFNMTPNVSAWTPGSGSSPLYYEELYNGNSDFANGAGDNAVKHENKSLGFNVQWNVNEQLTLTMDYHNSSAESTPDSPYGSSNTLSSAGFFRAGNIADFSGNFPILTLILPPGQTAIDPSQMLVTGSVFSNNYNRAEIEQWQGSGEFVFENYSKLNFGVASTTYNNRSAFTNVQLDTWGGATSSADYPDQVWQLEHMGDYFDQFNGASNPNFTDDFFGFDFGTVRQLAADAWVRAGKGVAADYLASYDYTGAPVPGSTANRTVGDSRVQEQSRSAYISWSNTFDWGLPVSVNAGVRYEETKILAQSLQPAPVGINWAGANEFNIVYSGSEFRREDGEYKYWLPNLDVAVDLTDQIKARASFSKTIGRPNWGDMNAATSLGGVARFDGGTGSSGNPGLKPLESDNIDLSAEWYYADASYVSLGYFHKKIDNFIASQASVQTPYDNVHTPAGGAYWNAAIAGGCASTDRPCIRDFIFANFNGQPGVNAAAGTIVGQPGDPVIPFTMSQPVNNRSDKLDGLEFNIQQMFGDSGFGLAANYTWVDSGLTYANGQLGTQFALTGLSDSANFVAFYEKYGWSVRAAYNWRGEFLNGLSDGKGSNPLYTEAYGQLDMNISYDVTENLTLSLEGINVTNETTRVHGRNSHQLYTVDQLGPRYMFGVRYNF